MPRVVDRAPAAQNRALGQILAETGTGQNGYGGGYGGARRPAPGQNFFSTLLTGAARGLLSVPIGPDAGLSSYALRGFGIGYLGARKDQASLRDRQIAEMAHQRAEARADERLQLSRDAFGDRKAQAAERQNDELQVDAFNKLQVADALEAGGIDQVLAEKLFSLDLGGFSPSQIGTTLQRYSEDVASGNPAAALKARDDLNDTLQRNRLIKIDNAIISHAQKGPEISGIASFDEANTREWKLAGERLQMMKARERKNMDSAGALRILRRRPGDPEFLQDDQERYMAYIQIAFTQLKEENGGANPPPEAVRAMMETLAVEGGWQVRPEQRLGLAP